MIISILQKIISVSLLLLLFPGLCGMFNSDSTSDGEHNSLKYAYGKDDMSVSSVNDSDLYSQLIIHINIIIERGRYSSQLKLGTVAGYKRS